MSWQSLLGSLFLASGVIAIAVQNYRNQSVKSNSDSQAALIVTLMASQEEHERRISEQDLLISELTAKVQVLETIPLAEINGHIASLVQAQAVVLKGQTEVLKLLRAMRNDNKSNGDIVKA